MFPEGALENHRNVPSINLGSYFFLVSFMVAMSRLTVHLFSNWVMVLSYVKANTSSVMYIFLPSGHQRFFFVFSRCLWWAFMNCISMWMVNEFHSLHKFSGSIKSAKMNEFSSLHFIFASKKLSRQIVCNIFPGLQHLLWVLPHLWCLTCTKLTLGQGQTCPLPTNIHSGQE